MIACSKYLHKRMKAPASVARVRKAADGGDEEEIDGGEDEEDFLNDLPRPVVARLLVLRDLQVCSLSHHSTKCDFITGGK